MMIITLKTESLGAAHEQGKLEISFGFITISPDDQTDPPPICGWIRLLCKKIRKHTGFH